MDRKMPGQSEGAIRLQKVLLLRARIEAGEYEIPAADLADRLLKESEKKEVRPLRIGPNAGNRS